MILFFSEKDGPKPSWQHGGNTKLMDRYFKESGQKPPRAEATDHIPEMFFRSDDGLLRQKTTIPFSMYYKIYDGDQLLHTMVYPGGMHYFVLPNDGLVHQHDHFELLYVLRGELINRIENVSYKYKKGDACLMNRNIAHADLPGRNCAVVFLNFSDRFIENLLSNDLISQSEGVPYTAAGTVRAFILANLHKDQRFYRNYLEFTETLQILQKPDPSEAELLIDQIQQELLDQAPGCSYMIQGLISRLIYVLETNYHINFMQLDSSNEEFLFARITNYLKESHGLISRNQLSAALNYNSEYLNQIVRKRTGSSLMHLARTYRLEYAQDLLLNTHDSIAEIIAKLGFVSSSHFYNFFRRETGMSPVQFRQHHPSSIYYEGDRPAKH